MPSSAELMVRRKALMSAARLLELLYSYVTQILAFARGYGKCVTRLSLIRYKMYLSWCEAAGGHWVGPAGPKQALHKGSSYIDGVYLHLRWFGAGRVPLLLLSEFCELRHI